MSDGAGGSKESSVSESTTAGGAGAADNIPRDFSRLSLFSSTSSASQDEQFCSKGHAEHSLSSMRHFLQDEKLCDVVLVAGENGPTVSAHKLVLSAASEYFAAMFTGNLRESGESKVVLRDINGDVLHAIVNYCYTGSVDIREDNVETLLSTACLMQLSEVVEACSRFLVNQLHPNNCLGIAVFAEHQNCNSLLIEANAYTNRNFMQVIKNQEFLQLSVDQIKTLLSSDDLNVSSEEQIFHALMEWIQYDPVNRKPNVGKLLGLIKLPLLDPAFLIDNVESSLGGSNADCQKLIMEAMKWHLLPERRLQMVSARTRPRKATLGRLLVVGGMDKNKGAMTIETYDPRSDEWKVAHVMNGRRLQFGVALLGDKLLVVGGRDGLKTLNTMECLDVENNIWTQLTTMNTHRHGLGVAVLGGPIYAVGGHDGWSYLSTVERYDPITRSWNYVAPMRYQRCSAGVAVLGGKLYAVGGRDSTSFLRTVESYDPHTNKWTECGPMNKRRSGVGVAVVNGFLYAMRGQDAPANNPSASRYDCIERYNPATDSWTVVTSLPTKRDGVATCLFGDKLITVGGYDGNNYLRTVEQYDPNTMEWITLAQLATGRAGACVLPIANPKEAD
ncbi:PREDICTED: kelch-like protein 5 [Nicrophorus vespilloides]|uniref:Kelch-like protein diablo n=1 Tax=Nicrophorus vespilloides TaxID=110193 RepID=A0ABM1MS29_NICVS|nr:PREDICTED: kelch-like protein 5 [Nicrophorus vespilloides]